MSVGNPQVPVPAKIKCPECDTELVPVNGEPPEECPKCHFVLSGWPEFQRWIKAWMKINPPVPPNPPEKEPIAEPRKKNPLANLTRKRKG
jgi:hypothetical protein